MAKSKPSPKQFERKQGNRSARGPKRKHISFSWQNLDNNQGQTIDEWEKEGLLADLIKRCQQISQYEPATALADQLIKQYTKVGMPPNSDFIDPKHVSVTTWAVIHIKPKSKEVVAGYLDSDEMVFYIIFLDKEHKFWPTDKQTKGKNKR